MIDEFGPGVTAYFTLIKMMVFVFFLMTLLAIPVLNINYNGHGYDHSFNSKEKLFLKTSLGNFGHAFSMCNHQYLDIDEAFHLHCAKGKLSEIWHYGLMPNQLDHSFRLDYCGANEGVHP